MMNQIVSESTPHGTTIDINSASQLIDDARYAGTTVNYEQFDQGPQSRMGFKFKPSGKGEHEIGSGRTFELKT
jgi:hypothetical protein